MTRNTLIHTRFNIYYSRRFSTVDDCNTALLSTVEADSRSPSPFFLSHLKMIAFDASWAIVREKKANQLIIRQFTVSQDTANATGKKRQFAQVKVKVISIPTH